MSYVVDEYPVVCCHQFVSRDIENNALHAIPKCASIGDVSNYFPPTLDPSGSILSNPFRLSWDMAFLTTPLESLAVAWSYAKQCVEGCIETGFLIDDSGWRCPTQALNTQAMEQQTWCYCVHHAMVLNKFLLTSNDSTVPTR
jgi:hypothetical protein